MRGINNNNPGNIRHGARWRGLAKTQTDRSFCQFVSPAYGIRALSKILDTYAARYHLHTVRGIISRWAPPSENDTAAYIASVADYMGISADATLKTEQRPALIQAIIRHENGAQPYTLAQINRGINLV